jgi:hypothetical protein
MMATYTGDDGTKYHYPASAIWKVGIPVAIVVGVAVWFLLF